MAMINKTGIYSTIFILLFVGNCLQYDTIYVFSVQLRTSSNPANINRFRSHTGERTGGASYGAKKVVLSAQQTNTYTYIHTHTHIRTHTNLLCKKLVLSAQHTHTHPNLLCKNVVLRAQQTHTHTRTHTQPNLLCTQTHTHTSKRACTNTHM